MIVYRVCHIDEMELLLNGNFNDAGKCYSRVLMKDTNKHDYMSGVKYMHFFDRLESILYLRRLTGFYLCYYDIPEGILEEGKGIGYYLDLSSFRNFDPVNEYAIPTSKLSMDYLVKIDRIDGRIDLDDYLENPDLSRYMNEMYVKDSDNRLVKKIK